MGGSTGGLVGGTVGGAAGALVGANFIERPSRRLEERVVCVREDSYYLEQKKHKHRQKRDD